MVHVARAGLCAALAACALATTTAAVAASDTLPIPKQGLYEWCDPSQSADGCASRLNRIGQAGFRVVNNGYVFHSNPTEQVLRAYAQHAAAAGVQVLWPFPTAFSTADPNGNSLLKGYSGLAKSCGCSTNQGFVAYVIGVLRSLPNTYGYYLADEPAQSTYAQQASWVSRVKALDPDHPRIIVGCGICSGGPDANVAWMSDLDIMLGSDAYPVTDGPPAPGYSYWSVQQNAGSLDRIATAAGRQQVMVLQSWSWGDSVSDAQAIGVDPARTRYPNRDEIEAQRNAAIQNSHPDLILWFTLTQVIGWEPGQGNSNWTNPTDTSTRWANLIGGAFAPPPPPLPPSTATATATATSASTSTSTSAPGQSGLPNRRPLARLAIRPLARLADRRGSRSRLTRRFVADGRTSRDPDGRIVRYVWTLNGRRVAGGGSGVRTFQIRGSGVQRIALTVTDNRGAKAAARRVFRVQR